MQRRRSKKTAAEKVDSILAVMPQMNDSEKDKALKLLIDFTTGSQDEKLYTRRYIDFAHSRKNIEGESWALLRLAQTYYTQWDTDSVFIYSDEAIRFAQRHKLYNDLSNLRNMLIRHYQKQGQTLTALRLAEEAYEDAKALDDHYLKSRVLANFGEIHYGLWQYEEATRFFLESIQEADKSRQPVSTFTSLSGVQKEMKYSLPLQMYGTAFGFAGWIITRFM